jgi:hypothetical protein
MSKECGAETLSITDAEIAEQEIAERKRRKKEYNDRYRKSENGKKKTKECADRLHAKYKKQKMAVAEMESNKTGVVKARPDKYPPENEDCEGECSVYACEVCSNFYLMSTLEDHPWFTKMGLAQPGHWTRDDIRHYDGAP